MKNHHVPLVFLIVLLVILSIFTVLHLRASLPGTPAPLKHGSAYKGRIVETSEKIEKIYLLFGKETAPRAKHTNNPELFYRIPGKIIKKIIFQDSSRTMGTVYIY